MIFQVLLMFNCFAAKFTKNCKSLQKRFHSLAKGIKYGVENLAAVVALDIHVPIVASNHEIINIYPKLAKKGYPTKI